MAKLTILLILGVVYGTSAQFFGGRNNLPGGGFSQQAGYKAGPVWGSLSQNVPALGPSGPITYGLGAGHTSPSGHGLSGSVLHQPGRGGLASVNGQLGLYNGPNNRVTGFAQHDRALDKNFNLVGPPTNSAGLRLDNVNGANAFVSGSKTSGLPATGTVGGSVPLYKDPTTSLNLGGQTTFGHGMKPNHQVGVTLEKKF